MKKMRPIFLFLLLIVSCSKNKIEKKGFAVNDAAIAQAEGIYQDTFQFETTPRNVLITKDKKHRLIPIYKVNYQKKTRMRFVGSNEYHWDYSNYGDDQGNRWNNNFMPGFEAVYGYNFVNIFHYDTEVELGNSFFEKPVLIKTLYYPAFSNDTLNNKSVVRTYYMVSVYDEDTNKDGFINVKDLRRFYHFDRSAKISVPLVPKEYSVMNSEYDPANDFMYVFARLDENSNGQMEVDEPTHIFWIDLSNPDNRGVQYNMGNK